MKKNIILFIVFVALCPSVSAKHLHLEKEYQKTFANRIGGKTEIVLEDGARVDILTDEYAIEVDFANKWAESIGQSLFYALKTNKKPAILLIIERPTRDLKYLKRLKTVTEKYDIKVFVITPDKLCQ